tara:strand:+ start:2591 stop:3394 length:804 start_codon:yes stop_codon:yes gene_type:complete
MSLTLLAVGLGISAAAGIGQSIQGIGQVSKSRKEMENLTKPEYIIPDEIKQNLTDAEQRQYYGLPDAQKREFLNNMQQSSTDALRSSATRRGGLQMVSNIQEQQNQMSNQLMIQDVQAREAKVSQLVDARREMAQQRIQKFAHEFSDYSSQLDYLRSQESAGIQNIFGGIDQVASTVTNAGTMMAMGGGDLEAGARAMNTPVPGGGNPTGGPQQKSQIYTAENQNQSFLNTDTSIEAMLQRQGGITGTQGGINPLTGLPYNNTMFKQ